MAGSRIPTQAELEKLNKLLEDTESKLDDVMNSYNSFRQSANDFKSHMRECIDKKGALGLFDKAAPQNNASTTSSPTEIKKP